MQEKNEIMVEQLAELVALLLPITNAMEVTPPKETHATNYVEMELT
jgi:hypothetical protein